MRYPVYPFTRPESVPADADSIHLVRPVHHAVLARIVEKTGLKEIYLAESCARRLSRKTRRFLEERGVQLVAKKKRGRVLSLSLEKIRQIIGLHQDDKTLREIQAQTGVPKSTVHYLIKYADRSKIRFQGKTVHLE
ncbi:MAG TPA: helix-turn-helix domain-containing protein [Candidatus Diapherotrites archaeon]|uniref:Helix-turn-helix domain-containing protein n=1 Tax=Candidatus Iainarchaeum sp. TaxID=3101447 RepID=A0A7J4JG97_9ARCH|nr:helix-turn-helix domain-containing protein [Candidatus Diapherotrites archaeon]HIH16783.1 helix-turn-helix domain-containing protein [Candidatus Diapherotrites archaeon]